MKEAEPHDGMSPAERIADYIARFADWRGPLLARLRTLILEADPALTEEWKWDIPVWSHTGNVVAISAFTAYPQSASYGKVEYGPCASRPFPLYSL